MTMPYDLHAIAAAMRAKCSSKDETYIPANEWVTNELHAHLSRNGRDWLLELSDVAPIPDDVAAAWLAAVGAPADTELRGAFDGKHRLAQWEDSSFDAAPELRAVTWWGRVGA